MERDLVGGAAGSCAGWCFPCGGPGGLAVSGGAADFSAHSISGPGCGDPEAARGLKGRCGEMRSLWAQEAGGWMLHVRLTAVPAEAGWAQKKDRVQ